MQGHCARHPEIPAVLTCERCGAFACPECVHDDTALCAACVEAGHAGVPVPWEAPGGGGVQVHAVQAYFQHWQRLSAGAAAAVALAPLVLPVGLCGSIFALAAYRQLVAAGALP